MHIGEALVSVTSSIHDKMVLDQVAGMVTSRNGDRTSCLQFCPMHIRKVQLICVIQCLNSVAASKDIDAIVVDAGRMSTATAGSLASCLWVCPCQGICVEHIELVKVLWSIATAKHVEALVVNKSRRVSTTRWRNRSICLWLRPVHGIGIKNVQGIEAVFGVTSSKDIDRLSNEVDGLGAEVLGWNLSMDLGTSPVHGWNGRGRNSCTRPWDVLAALRPCSVLVG